MILIAGPYRSGTNDEPARIEANVRLMEEVAYQVWLRGHLPVLGEWLALPLVAQAGSTRIGDEAFNAIFHPSSSLLLQRCDACLRVGGASQGADQMVAEARLAGKQVYVDLTELPVRTTT
jgi:hypothetical protein